MPNRQPVRTSIAAQGFNLLATTISPIWSIFIVAESLTSGTSNASI